MNLEAWRWNKVFQRFKGHEKVWVFIHTYFIPIYPYKVLENVNTGGWTRASSLVMNKYIGKITLNV